MSTYIVSLDPEGRIPIRTVVVPDPVTEPANRAASVGYGRFDHVFGALQQDCPDHVEFHRWQQKGGLRFPARLVMCRTRSPSVAIQFNEWQNALEAAR
jgi:hypothetical protein